jgi:hypothetical protein
MVLGFVPTKVNKAYTMMMYQFSVSIRVCGHLFDDWQKSAVHARHERYGCTSPVLRALRKSFAPYNRSILNGKPFFVVEYMNNSTTVYLDSTRTFQFLSSIIHQVNTQYHYFQI